MFTSEESQKAFLHPHVTGMPSQDLPHRLPIAVLRGGDEGLRTSTLKRELDANLQLRGVGILCHLGALNSSRKLSSAFGCSFLGFPLAVAAFNMACHHTLDEWTSYSIRLSKVNS